MSRVLITPTVGGAFVAVDGAEIFKPMDAHAMLVLIDRLSEAARETLRAEREARQPVDGWAPVATFDDDATRNLR